MHRNGKAIGSGSKGCLRPVMLADGIEAWFSIPGQAVKPPLRDKMALLTWGAVYGLINLLNRFITPSLQAFSLWITPLFICGLMVGLLTYLVMPQVPRLFAPWLYPSL